MNPRRLFPSDGGRPTLYRAMNCLCAFALFASTSALAETQCIRSGNEEIVLFTDEQEYCPTQILPLDRKLGWKLANSADRAGCWRSDDRFVYVMLESASRPYLTNIATGATPDDEREFGVEGGGKMSRKLGTQSLADISGKG
jgi:hypothetical protein